MFELLEGSTFRLLAQGEGVLNLFFLAVSVAGFLLVLLVWRGDVERMPRAPFFASCMLVTLCTSLSATIWLLTPLALNHGAVWVVMAGQIGALAVCGGWWASLCKARSTDIVGSGRLALLGVIPLANLWLLLKRSDLAVPADPRATIPLLRGGWGVLTGAAIFVATVGVEVETDRRLRAQERDMPPEQMVEAVIRAQGLEVWLRRMAAAAPTPYRVDEATVLEGLEARGTALRRSYRVSLEGVAMSDAFRETIDQAVCAEPTLRVTLSHGARLQEIYYDSAGGHIGRHEVTIDRCPP